MYRLDRIDRGIFDKKQFIQEYIWKTAGRAVKDTAEKGGWNFKEMGGVLKRNMQVTPF
jgi:hypothetical protein